MSNDYSRARKIIIDYLRNQKETDLSAGYGTIIGIEHLVKDFHISKKMIKQIFHDLYLDRIIITGNINESHDTLITLNWPKFEFTEWGRSIVELDEYDPYDPEGYRNKFKNEITNLDETILIYLVEAMNCFRLNYLLSSSVMLGGAAEKAILMLIESFRNTITDAKDQKDYDNETNASKGIKKRFDAFMKRFRTIMSTLPNNVTDDIEVILERTCDLIRRTRNNAGHPTGKKIAKENVRANLILFPIFCKSIYSLMNCFENHIKP